MSRLLSSDSRHQDLQHIIQPQAHLRVELPDPGLKVPGNQVSPALHVSLQVSVQLHKRVQSDPGGGADQVPPANQKIVIFSAQASRGVKRIPESEFQIVELPVADRYEVKEDVVEYESQVIKPHLVKHGENPEQESPDHQVLCLQAGP